MPAETLAWILILAVEAAYRALLAMYSHHVSSPYAQPAYRHLAPLWRRRDRNASAFNKAVACCFQILHL
jgi:hypothetical protein